MSSKSRGGAPGASGLSGDLSKSPFFVVLRRIQREGLTGTLSVLRGEQVRQFFFEGGDLHAARSSREDHRIGATLVRWGYISEPDLKEALETQQRTHERIDQVLIEKGLVTRAIVDSEARRQMEQIVFSTLSWPDGAFHFEANTGPFDLDVAVSLTEEMIIEGIRRIPESEQFLELLGDLTAVPSLKPRAQESVSFRLLRDVAGLIGRIDGKSDLKTILRTDRSGSATAKILYSLLFAGLIDLRPSDSASPATAPPAAPSQPTETGFRLEPRKSGQFRAAPASPPPEEPAPEPPASAPPARPVAPTDRQIVMETYRRLDWLSHYDLLGVSCKASAQEIEEAYRARARLFDPTLKAHPELVDCWRQLTVLAKWLKVAYEMLSNPLTREAYDAKIAEAGVGRPTEPGTPAKS